jgi:hypothetical protein
MLNGSGAQPRLDMLPLPECAISEDYHYRVYLCCAIASNIIQQNTEHPLCGSPEWNNLEIDKDDKMPFYQMLIEAGIISRYYTVCPLHSMTMPLRAAGKMRNTKSGQFM